MLTLVFLQHLSDLGESADVAAQWTSVAIFAAIGGVFFLCTICSVLFYSMYLPDSSDLNDTDIHTEGGGYVETVFVPPYST